MSSARCKPLPGAKEFLDELRSLVQVIILSDTFEQFATPLLRQLDWPTLLCHRLVVENDRIVNYQLRVPDQKRKAVAALQVAELPRHFRRRFLQRHRDVARSERRFPHPCAGKGETGISAVQSRRIAGRFVETDQSRVKIVIRPRPRFSMTRTTTRTRRMG